MQKILSLLFMIGLLFGSCSAKQPVTPDRPSQTPTHNIQVEVLAEGLQNPWSMVFLPDGRMLITERPGRLRIFANGELQTEAISGLPPIWQNGQGGLLDVALHPDYEQNGWIYFAYASAEGNVGNTALARARLQGNQLVDFERLFRGEPLTDLSYHFGSRIVFDAENNVYFTIGDRGEMQNAQKTDNHNGKVLRIRDDGRIPADNPFVNQPNAKKEIWTYGHRNIQGMAIHPETGEIWTHEHGPKGGDEINIEVKGANYGWPLVSFGINYDGTILTNDTVMEGVNKPLHYWVPSIAPCGMCFVTSDKYPNWKNNLMVTALAGQQIQRLTIEGTHVVDTEKLLLGYARFRDIRQGLDGYLYVLTEGPGRLLRLIPE